MNIFKRLFIKLDNLFSRKKYFNKMATVNLYLSKTKKSERPHVENFEELYEVALKYVGEQDFASYTEGMKDYFHELTKAETIIAISLGVVSYGIACALDAKGKDIEESIDKLLPKDKDGRGFDVNNAFDLKSGKGHRIFGHDIPTFGIKNIPADYIIQIRDGKGFQYAKLGDFLGIPGQDKFSMWDIIWSFYSSPDKSRFKNVMTCLGHIIAHFGKDIFTPDGLPLPFTSLFNEFTQSTEYDGLVLKYKNSFMQKLDTRRLFMKASDFATMILIEGFIEFYCNSKRKKVDDMNGFRHDMKVIAMGTCISLQLATILIGEGIQAKKGSVRKNVPGGKVNVLMSGAFLKITVQEMKSIIKARADVNSFYNELLEENK